MALSTAQAVDAEEATPPENPTVPVRDVGSTWGGTVGQAALGGGGPRAEAPAIQPIHPPALTRRDPDIEHGAVKRSTTLRRSTSVTFAPNTHPSTAKMDKLFGLTGQKSSSFRKKRPMGVPSAPVFRNRAWEAQKGEGEMSSQQLLNSRQTRDSFWGESEELGRYRKTLSYRFAQMLFAVLIISALAFSALFLVSKKPLSDAHCIPPINSSRVFKAEYSTGAGKLPTHLSAVHDEAVQAGEWLVVEMRSKWDGVRNVLIFCVFIGFGGAMYVLMTEGDIFDVHITPPDGTSLVFRLLPGVDDRLLFSRLVIGYSIVFCCFIPNAVNRWQEGQLEDWGRDNTNHIGIVRDFAFSSFGIANVLAASGSWYLQHSHSSLARKIYKILNQHRRQIECIFKDQLQKERKQNRNKYGVSVADKKIKFNPKIFEYMVRKVLRRNPSDDITEIISDEEVTRRLQKYQKPSGYNDISFKNFVRLIEPIVVTHLKEFEELAKLIDQSTNKDDWTSVSLWNGTQPLYKQDTDRNHGGGCCKALREWSRADYATMEMTALAVLARDCPYGSFVKKARTKSLNFFNDTDKNGAYYAKDDLTHHESCAVKYRDSDKKRVPCTCALTKRGGLRTSYTIFGFPDNEYLGYTPLHFAARFNPFAEVIEALIGVTQDDLDSYETTGQLDIKPWATEQLKQYTPAARSSGTKLISHGKRDAQRGSDLPLHLAARYNKSKRVKRLLATAYPQSMQEGIAAKNLRGHTPFQVAIRSNARDLERWFVAGGPLRGVHVDLKTLTEDHLNKWPHVYDTFLKRYKCDRPVHKSQRSYVMYATDVETDDSVCLKLMQHRDEFLKEVQNRFQKRKENDDQMVADASLTNAVIEVRRIHIPANDRMDELGQIRKNHPCLSKKSSLLDPAKTDFPYVLVMERAEHSLLEACLKDRVAGYQISRDKSFNVISTIQSILYCVKKLHECTIVHGDLKPRNILRRLGNVSQEVQERQKRQEEKVSTIFDKFDQDKNGMLEGSELRELLQELRIPLDNDVRIDDGVTRTEFLKWYNRNSSDWDKAHDRWILCDMDSAVEVGEEIKSKSTAYAPPEVAIALEQGQALNADTTLDVWSLGVIIYEMCAGTTLFAQDISNDALANSIDKTRLCLWHTISDEELSPVFGEQAEGNNATAQIRDDAKNLIRWCLKGKPTERPTIDDMLDHRFLEPTSKPPERKDIEYHAFLSYNQADASGTAKALFHQLKNLGLHAWLDMQQQTITLEGMRAGVKNSDVFILILSENVLARWFCQQEILCAIQYDKPIHIVLEMPTQESDPHLSKRFRPFDLDYWNSDGFTKRQIKVWGQDTELQTRKEIYQAVAVKHDPEDSSSEGKWQADFVKTEKYTTTVREVNIDEALTTKLVEEVNRALDNAVIFRRREYEEHAMMRELCCRCKKIYPKPRKAVWQSTPLKIFVICAQSGQLMKDKVLEGLQNDPNETLAGEADGGSGMFCHAKNPDEADCVLLFLSEGVLEIVKGNPCKSLEALEAVLRKDDQYHKATQLFCDRIVTIMDEATWQFDCDEQKSAPEQVQACVRDHEAITYREKDNGRLRPDHLDFTGPVKSVAAADFTAADFTAADFTAAANFTGPVKSRWSGLRLKGR
jgi:serine/threonine protein kinase